MRVHENWQKASLASTCKEKGERLTVRLTFKSMLCRVVIVSSRDVAKWSMGEEKCGYWKGSGHEDQRHTAKQVTEKYYGKDQRKKMRVIPMFFLLWV